VELRVGLLIFARDPDRARAFYAQILGWVPPGGRPSRWATTTDGDPRVGTDGADPTGADRAEEPYLPAIHGSDVTAAGGEILAPRIPLPGAGWLVHLADKDDDVAGVTHDGRQVAWPPPPPR